VLFAVMLAGIGTGTAAAQDGARSAFQLDPAVDATVLTLSAGLAALGQVVIEADNRTRTLPTDNAGLIFLDRWVVEQSEPSSISGLLTDMSVGSLLAYGLIDGLLAATLYEDQGGAWAELVIYAETVLINWAVANMVKTAFGRARPLTHWMRRDGERTSNNGEHFLSFYSLHTALSAGVTAVASYIAAERWGSAWPAWVIAGVGTVATAYVGVGRILSMNHFTTDVLAGAMIGASIGLLVTYLHRRESDDEGARLTVSPVMTAESVGGVLLGVSGRL
jgi:undecaprenyl-diphosphatase